MSCKSELVVIEVNDEVVDSLVRLSKLTVKKLLIITRRNVYFSHKKILVILTSVIFYTPIAAILCNCNVLIMRRCYQQLCVCWLAR